MTRRYRPNKPTKAEYALLLTTQYPGATITESEHGLYAVVRSAEVAMTIELEAREAGLKPTGIDRRGPEDYLVRMYGFSIRKKESQ